MSGCSTKGNNANAKLQIARIIRNNRFPLIIDNQTVIIALASESGYDLFLLDFARSWALEHGIDLA